MGVLNTVIRRFFVMDNKCSRALFRMDLECLRENDPKLLGT